MRTGIILTLLHSRVYFSQFNFSNFTFYLIESSGGTGPEKLQQPPHYEGKVLILAA